MPNSSKLFKVLVPLTSVLAGLVVGAIVMAIFGYDPFLNYASLFTGALGDANAIGETLRELTPLILTALGFSIASTAGFFNIGGAGQALMGWMASVSFALNFSSLPHWLLLLGSIMAGAIAGGIWAGIAGVLKAYLGTSEVITTIMLNYIALYLSSFLVKNFLAQDQSDFSKTIPEGARLRTPFLEHLTQNSTFNYGIIISLIMVIVVYFLIQRTKVGYEYRAVGLNDKAANYAGMNVKKVIISAMVVSGALAGLGGAVEGLGNYENIYVMTSLPDIGFNGMAVSLLASGNPIGIVFSGLLFSILKIGGLSISVVSTTPPEIVDIVIATIIFFVGINYVIKIGLEKLSKKKGEG